MAPLPESTVDTRLAEALEALLVAEVGEHLAGGVCFLEEPQQLERPSLKLPMLAGFLERFGERVLEKDHETGVLLALVEKVERARNTDPARRWWRQRLSYLVQDTVLRASEDGDLLAEGDRYLYSLTTFDRQPTYYLSDQRAHLVTPMRLTLHTHRLFFE